MRKRIEHGSKRIMANHGRRGVSPLLPHATGRQIYAEIGMHHSTALKLFNYAAVQGLTVVELLDTLIETIAKDDLFEAVLK